PPRRTRRSSPQDRCQGGIRSSSPHPSRQQRRLHEPSPPLLPPRPAGTDGAPEPIASRPRWRCQNACPPPRNPPKPPHPHPRHPPRRPDSPPPPQRAALRGPARDTPPTRGAVAIEAPPPPPDRTLAGPPEIPLPLSPPPRPPASAGANPCPPADRDGIVRCPI